MKVEIELSSDQIHTILVEELTEAMSMCEDDYIRASMRDTIMYYLSFDEGLQWAADYDEFLV